MYLGLASRHEYSIETVPFALDRDKMKGPFPTTMVILVQRYRLTQWKGYDTSITIIIPLV